MDVTEQPVKTARDAGNRFVSQHMLAQTVSTAQLFFPHYPIFIVTGVWGLCPHV